MSTALRPNSSYTERLKVSPVNRCEVTVSHLGQFQSALWWLQKVLERFHYLQENTQAGIAVPPMRPVGAKNAWNEASNLLLGSWWIQKKRNNRSMITWFAQVIYSMSRIHTHCGVFVIWQEAPYILSQLCASFDYFHLVNWVADSLQRWISSNTIYQTPEHFRVCLRKPQPKNMSERVRVSVFAW